jgi:hypothetical protein
MHSSNSRDSDHEELCGVIERITYHSQESGYTIILKIVMENIVRQSL